MIHLVRLSLALAISQTMAALVKGEGVHTHLCSNLLCFLLVVDQGLCDFSVLGTLLTLLDLELPKCLLKAVNGCLLLVMILVSLLNLQLLLLLQGSYLSCTCFLQHYR